MYTFQVFLYLVQEKLKEMGILFNVKEIITDFELNIHKSVDEMLPGISILGCFFHLVKAFKKKIEQKKMKTEYENNPLFHKFIKQSVALSSLPLEDVETGYHWLKENVSFDDPKIESFKIEFLQYIDTYWLNGCIPPYVWSTWGRKDDWTNNNQEGKDFCCNFILSFPIFGPSDLCVPKAGTVKNHPTSACFDLLMSRVSLII